MDNLEKIFEEHCKKSTLYKHSVDQGMPKINTEIEFNTGKSIKVSGRLVSAEIKVPYNRVTIVIDVDQKSKTEEVER